MLTLSVYRRGIVLCTLELVKKSGDFSPAISAWLRARLCCLLLSIAACFGYNPCRAILVSVLISLESVVCATFCWSINRRRTYSWFTNWPESLINRIVLCFYLKDSFPKHFAIYSRNLLFFSVFYSGFYSSICFFWPITLGVRLLAVGLRSLSRWNEARRVLSESDLLLCVELKHSTLIVLRFVKRLVWFCNEFAKGLALNLIADFEILRFGSENSYALFARPFLNFEIETYPKLFLPDGNF